MNNLGTMHAHVQPFQTQPDRLCQVGLGAHPALWSDSDPNLKNIVLLVVMTYCITFQSKNWPAREEMAERHLTNWYVIDN